MIGQRIWALGATAAGSRVWVQARIMSIDVPHLGKPTFVVRYLEGYCVNMEGRHDVKEVRTPEEHARHLLTA